MAIMNYELRAGTYYDSAVLMQLQRGLADLPGVLEAGVVMATQANLDLLREGDLMPSEPLDVHPEDLLIVIKGQDEGAVDGAFGKIDELLAHRPTATAGLFKPRSLDTASRQLPGAHWTLISVPGRYAAEVAHQALELGKHVFLYSDNVSVEEERNLKLAAQARGLLVMGPDCGTAIINGTGFGFANRVRRGGVGIVGASGTGMQAISAGVHNLGGGISQAIGTGGRDLKTDIGGTTALQGLDLLARDPDTKVIVFVSKPPDQEVAATLIATAGRLGKPVVIYFIGFPPPARNVGNLYYASGLEDAARLGVKLLNEEPLPPSLPEKDQISDAQGFLRGLFSGGTLAYEAVLGLQTSLDPIFTNVPLYESQRLPNPVKSQAHTIVDLGSDEFTQGRLHPMIDNDLRLRRFQQEVEDPQTSCILLDFVLGDGAHMDPAAEFAPLVRDATKKRKLEVLAVVVGTDEDPQGLDGQLAQLDAAGARTFTDLGPALQFVTQYFGKSESETKSSGPAVSLAGLTEPVAAINVGLESFFGSLLEQGAEAVHVDWRPPAGGNQQLMDILKKMSS